jgi:phytoene dehydrogenase-like protein
MNSLRNAVVIGGGPAGLLSAAHLADAGWSTTLLEASGTLGGRAASRRRDGFDLTHGPHALYAGGPAMRELTALGIDLPRWNPASHRSFFIEAGRPRRSPGGTPALIQWLRRVRHTDPGQLCGRSVAEWLDETVPSPTARPAAEALVRVATFVADHESLSADVAARQVRAALLPGVRYVRGGWQTLVDALHKQAELRGATVHRRCGVRSLQRDGDGWSVELDDRMLGADVVVVAVGEPGAAAKLLGDRAPAPPGPAAEVSALDLGLSSLPKRGRWFALGLDDATYLSKHSPPGHRDGVLLSLGGYTRQPRDVLEGVADAVQPGWRDRVTLDRFLPRMTAVSAIATPHTGGLPGRPGVDLGHGLFIAGDWIGSEGWLVDAALASGAAAARAATAAVADRRANVAV